MNEAPQKTCRRKPEEATRPPGWLRCCCSDTPLIRQTQAAGSLPELCIGRWMRLMLFCCTWKEERMGEEEGKKAPRDCVGRRRVCAHCCASVPVRLTLNISKYYIPNKLLLDPSQLSQFLCVCWASEATVSFHIYLAIMNNSDLFLLFLQQFTSNVPNIFCT